MTFATYQLAIWEVATNTLKEIIPLNESITLTYEVLVNDISTLALVMPDDMHDLREIFADYNIIDVQREDPDGDLVTEESYFVVGFNRVTADDGQRVIISGLSLNTLMEGRIVDPADDSTQPNGGYATKAGDAAQVIRAYVREQLGDLSSTSRSAPRFSIPLYPDSGESVGANLRHQ